MLKTRVITAIFLLIGFAGVLFVLPTWVASFAFAMIAALAAWEWGKLLKASSGACILFAWATLAAAEYLTVSRQIWTAFPLLCAVSVLFWLLVVPLWFRRRWELTANLKGYLIGWIVILPTWSAMLMLYRKSPLILLAAMALVWIADIAAYFTGRAIGKNKLAPSISPGKTREGVVGAVIAVIAYGVSLGMHFWPDMSPMRTIGLVLILIVLTTLSVIGDLYESMLKRQAGVKDSSNLLPGHGGVLDRIDSQTSTLPLVALYFYWIGL